MLGEYTLHRRDLQAVREQLEAEGLGVGVRRPAGSHCGPNGRDACDDGVEHCPRSSPVPFRTSSIGFRWLASQRRTQSARGDVRRDSYRRASRLPCPSWCGVVPPELLADAEIHDLHYQAIMRVLVQEDVRRFEIAVNDARCVRVD